MTKSEDYQSQRERIFPPAAWRRWWCRQTRTDAYWTPPERVWSDESCAPPRRLYSSTNSRCSLNAQTEQTRVITSDHVSARGPGWMRLPAILPLASPGIPCICVKLLRTKYSSHVAFNSEPVQKCDHRSVVFSTSGRDSVMLSVSLVEMLAGTAGTRCVLAHGLLSSLSWEMLRSPSIQTLQVKHTLHVLNECLNAFKIIDNNVAIITSQLYLMKLKTARKKDELTSFPNFLF